MNKILKFLEDRFYPTSRMEDPDWEDGNININDWAGGNFDDAYSMGMQDGRQELIQALIQQIKEGKFND